MLGKRVIKNLEWTQNSTSQRGSVGGEEAKNGEMAVGSERTQILLSHIKRNCKRSTPWVKMSIKWDPQR